MANYDHSTHATRPLSMMISDGSRLLFLNQSMPSFPDPFLIWVVDQFNQRYSPDLTDSSTLQCHCSLVISIQWDCVFLPQRRFVSGAFPCRRYFVRLSTGDCPLTQGYGGFTWVFDPGINRGLAEDEDIIKLVETKKISHAQWISSGDLVSLFGSVEDGNYDSDLSVSNRNTEESRKLVRMIKRQAIYKTTGKLLLGLRLEEFLALMEFTQVCLVVINICCTTIQMARSLFGVFVKDATGISVMFSLQDHDNFERLSFIFEKTASKLWLHQFCYSLYGILRLHVNMSKYWLDSLNKPWKDKKQRVTIAEIYDLVIVVTTNKCRWDRIGRQQKSIYFRVMVTNEHICIRRFQGHGLEPIQTTYHNFLLITVMRKAFRSFIYKMIAFYECMKRGLNRFILLPVRLLLESRVTSTSSSKLGFNFLYLFQRLYLNGFLYHVSCKPFLK